MLIAPVGDGAAGMPSLFDADGTTPARHFRLISMERRKGDLVWLRYKVRRGRRR